MKKNKKNFKDKNYDNLYVIFNGFGNLFIIISVIIIMITGVIKIMPTPEERIAKQQEKLLLEEKKKQELIAKEEEKKKQEEAIKEADYQRLVKEMNSMINHSENTYRQLLVDNKLKHEFTKEFTMLKVEIYTNPVDNSIVYRLYDEEKNLDKLVTLDMTDLNLNLIGFKEITENVIKIADIKANKTISIKVLTNDIEVILEDEVNNTYLFTDGEFDYSIIKNNNKNIADIDTDAYTHDVTEEQWINIVLAGDKKYRPILKDYKTRKNLKLIEEKYFNTFKTAMFYNKEDNEMAIYIQGEINGVKVDRVVAYGFRNDYSTAELYLLFNGETFLIYDKANTVSILIDLTKDKEPISIDLVAPKHYEGYDSLL